MVIRVGILGSGFAKSVQIPGFTNHEAFTVNAIWAHRQEKAELIAEEFGIEKVYSTWEELIADPNLDLISIVTPVHQHFEITMEAIDQGKHILCEKPMAFDVSEAMMMHNEAAKKEIIAMINHEFRQLPERRYFHDLIRQGMLGQIYEINVDMSSSGRLPQSNNDRKWNWWADLHHGGGLWGALGSHLIDFVLWTFGKIESITGTISTNSTHLKDAITGQSRLVTSDDSFQVLFILEHGIKGRLTGSMTRHGESGTLFEAFGSDGALRVARDRSIWKGNGYNWEQLEIPEKYLLRSISENEPWLIPPFEVLIDHMASGIEQKSNPSPSFEDGLNVQLVLDALREADMKQAWVKI